MRLLKRIEGKRKNRKALENSGGWVGKIFLKVYCTSANCKWWSYDVIRIICASTQCWNKPYHWLIPVHTTGGFTCPCNSTSITRERHAASLAFSHYYNSIR